MNKQKYAEIFDAAAHRIPEDIDLGPRITAQITKKKGVLMSTRTKALLVSVIVLLMISILAISGPEIARAMKELLGYIPGTGLIDSSAPVRGIDEPVTQTQDGVRVTVAQVVADSQHTVVQFSLGGIPSSAYVRYYEDLGNAEECDEHPVLYLSDGTRVDTVVPYIYDELPEYYVRNLPNYLFSWYFDAVPPDNDQVTLKMPCIRGTFSGSVPENWEFRLQLINTPSNLQITPVIQLPTPMPVENEPTITPQNDEVASAPVPDIYLRLEQAVPVDDGGYRVYGNLSWEEDSPYDRVEMETYQWTDAEGQRLNYIILSPDPTVWSQLSGGVHETPFAFQLYEPKNPGPVTLNVTRVGVSMNVDAEFSFDTGPASQVGQHWDLNQDLLVGGFRIRVVSATRLEDGYSFVFQSNEPALERFSVGIALKDSLEGNLVIYGPGFFDTGTAGSDLVFDVSIPSGMLTIKLITFGFDGIPGDWQVTWIPPEE